MKKFVLILFWATLSFAAKPMSLESATRFQAAELFAKLDSISGGASWMEWDADALLDPEIAKIVCDKNGKIRSAIEHGWFVEGKGRKSLFAVLEKNGNGEKISVFEIAKLSTKKIPLDIQEPLNPKEVFRDYQEKIPGQFVHFDDSNLQVIVRENEIQFSYLKPDAEALLPIFDFKNLPELQKQAEIQGRKDFYAYEYSLMVQAFVASTRGLFNWQIWHWVKDTWTKSAKISSKEIEAILGSPDQGKFVRIFFQKLASGGSVEMQSNSHGSFLMIIRR